MCVVDGDCAGTGCAAGACVSCGDGRQNDMETDVDCGGPECPGCADTLMCTVGSDCAGERCVGGMCVSCMDMTRNAEETDVDCGGGLCPPCADRLMCMVGSDCAGGACESGRCVSCSDGVRNQDETDVDCGGSACTARCAPTRMCTVAGDCASGICLSGQCSTPGCTDMVQNGMESDVDCGGPTCPGCPVGDTCTAGSDCAEGVCGAAMTCSAPTCSDGVANGTETDIDCGGPGTCPRCADYRICTAPSDCMTAMCTMGRCGATGLLGQAILIGHDYFASTANEDRLLGNAVFASLVTGTLQILEYTQYSDNSASGEAARGRAAINARATALGRSVVFTPLTNYTNLATALVGKDVLLVHEQESTSSTTMATVAAAWNPILNTFVNMGGVVVVCDFSGGSWQVLNGPGLMTIPSAINATSQPLTIAAPADPVVAGVTAYSAPNGSNSYPSATGGTVVVRQTSTGNPVVLHLTR
jgi:hypothetical protein